MESFKHIAGTNGKYAIGNRGTVISFCNKKYPLGREIKSFDNKRGYLSINLVVNGIRTGLTIHKLVATHFMDFSPNGMNSVIEHLNGNKKDNNVSNLMVSTQRKNIQNYFTTKKSKSSKYVGVSWCNSNKKWKAQIYIDGKAVFLGHRKSELEALELYKTAETNFLSERTND